MADVTCPEQWRSVPGFEGRYEVSDRGRVRSLTSPFQRQRGRVLTPNSAGAYLKVQLCRAGEKRYRNVHALVAEAWLGPRPEGRQVRHLDGDARNCRLSNLAYGTPSVNQLDSVRHGTHKEARKTECPHGHPYDESNTYFDRRGKRKCRACGRIRRRAQYARSRSNI